VSLEFCRRLPAYFTSKGMGHDRFEEEGMGHDRGLFVVLRVAHGERNYGDPHMYCDTCQHGDLGD
jgi:hypothetical protein